MTNPARRAVLAGATLWLFAGIPALAQSFFEHPLNAKPFTEKPFATAAGNFSFAVLADRTGGARPGVFEQAIAHLNLLKPEFVISVGDLVEGYTDDPTSIQLQWQDLDRIIAPLDMRFFFVPGNHDLGNSAMLGAWRRRMGNTYYSFVYKNVLFLVLDTDDPPPGAVDAAEEIQKLLETDPRRAKELISQRVRALDIPIEDLTPASIGDQQVEWARRTLAKHGNVRWTIVLLHKPAWLQATAANKFSSVQEALSDRRYTVFAGHGHYYQHDTIDGHEYFRLGTTGGKFVREGPGAIDHLSWVTMDARGPHVANIRIGGVFGPTGPTGSDAQQQ